MLTGTRSAAQPGAPKPFSLPFKDPPGPDTWLLAQPYGNTVGAYFQRDTTYRFGQGIHFGVDFSAPCGTEIVAIADGVVFAVDNLNFGSAPHNLMIDHPDLGYASFYGHLLERPRVQPGQRVKAGEVVALSGDPAGPLRQAQGIACYGRPHLHLEIRLASQEGFTLLLENEKEIVGDTPERCHAILRAIENPGLRFAWDPANFVQVNVARPTGQGWPLLGPYVAHVHVKDARRADGRVEVAGEGDGQVGELLSALRDSGYQGFLALEPHLVVAGHSGGFSGAQGMARAAGALRRLLSDLGWAEQTALASETILRRDWDRPEEDAAWAHL